ncbi:hypothetical protein [Priestia koreensis]|uniref:hypothetical protein n=1 Tax=Priestia koreensis TaxID=284581 RepID=UPI0030186640
MKSAIVPSEGVAPLTSLYVTLVNNLMSGIAIVRNTAAVADRSRSVSKTGSAHGLSAIRVSLSKILARFKRQISAVERF